MHVFLHALLDTLKLAPLIFLVHLLIEVFERKAYHKIKFKKIMKSPLSPLFATGLGLIPQCGFSVIATNLYVTKRITVGTLLAVYVATSDEAIPILLSSPDGIVKVLPLLAIKTIMALIIGFGSDGLIKLFNKKSKKIAEFNENLQLNTDDEVIDNACHENVCDTVEQPHNNTKENEEIEQEIGCACSHAHHHSHTLEVDKDGDYVLKGCHGHKVIGDKGVLSYFLHPLEHTATILLYIFIVNLILGSIMHFIPREKINAFMTFSQPLQPLMVAIIGFIPNCSASVFITQLYSQGFIMLGSTICGLSVNAGIGLAVLIKDNRPVKNTVFIIITLILFSLLCGILINCLTNLWV